MPKKGQEHLSYRDRPQQRIARGTSFTSTARFIHKNLASSSPLVKKKIKDKASGSDVFKKYRRYKYDPAGFIEDILGLTLTEKQKEICDALVEYRFLLCRSSHAVGKSYLLGALLVWMFYCWQPLKGIVTAPTKEHVTDVAFSYTRTFVEDSNLDDFFPGPSVPTMESRKSHSLKGVVTSNAEAIQGRHSANVFVAIDEAVGVEYDMHEALESLYIGDEVFVIMFYNPTRPDSHISTLEVQEGWHTITISCENHPNVIKGIEHLRAGKNPDKDVPFPGAITLSRFEQLLKQWSTEIDKDMYDAERDVILPSTTIYDDPERYRYFRPDNRAESRLLGRWPSESSDNVFSEYIIDTARIYKPDEITDFSYDKGTPIAVGIDVARKGDDYSCIAVKVGPYYKLVKLYGDQRNTQLAGKAIEILKQLELDYSVSQYEIPVAVDGIGLGSGVIDILWEQNYNVIEVHIQEKAYESEQYDCLRSELWFNLKDNLINGSVSFAQLPSDIFKSLRKQLLGPRYDHDSKGRRKVESKKLTKKRIKRSPDIADAICLAEFCTTEYSGWSTATDEEDDDYELIWDDYELI